MIFFCLYIFYFNLNLDKSTEISYIYNGFDSYKKKFHFIIGRVIVHSFIYIRTHNIRTNLLKSKISHIKNEISNSIQRGSFASTYSRATSGQEKRNQRFLFTWFRYGVNSQILSIIHAHTQCPCNYYSQ